MPRVLRLASPSPLARLCVGVLVALSSVVVLSPATLARAAGETEFAGKFNAELIPNRDELEQVVLRPVRDLSKIKFATPPEASDALAGNRLYHPPEDKSSLLAILVEPKDDAPYLYVDVNNDNTLSADERFALNRTAEDKPYLLEATVKLPFGSGTPFTSFPLHVQYFKGAEWEEMKEGERMLLQSKTAFANGVVEIQGRKTLVQYGFNPGTKKINASNGWVAVDGNGDGEIEMERFSPEAAEAREESVVFRAGDVYVSTKRVDVEKNQIILRSHPASEYKRVELLIGNELPDFAFTDFGGKKRRLSEFRGKYVLLDFWAAWCGPCRREMPYLKAAYARYQARGFEILGLNNDLDITPVKDWLKKNGLTWTQATPESIRDVLRAYRIDRYPTTMLIGPDGKILSLNQHKKNQPILRGQRLLKTLDELLPL